MARSHDGRLGSASQEPPLWGSIVVGAVLVGLTLGLAYALFGGQEWPFHSRETIALAKGAVGHPLDEALGMLDGRAVEMIERADLGNSRFTVRNEHPPSFPTRRAAVVLRGASVVYLFVDDRDRVVDVFVGGS